MASSPSRDPASETKNASSRATTPAVVSQAEVKVCSFLLHILKCSAQARFQRDVRLADPLGTSVRRNPKGGVYVNPAELRQCFDFFDADGKGVITLQDLKKRLHIFYQNLSLREYKFLMNSKQELKYEDLYHLLAHNDLASYDPVAEAFKVYDPNDTGFIDLTVFREILTNLGFGNITDQDMQTLVQSADADGDGRVSLADFRKMLPSSSASR